MRKRSNPDKIYKISLRVEKNNDHMMYLEGDRYLYHVLLNEQLYETLKERFKEK